MNAKSQLPDLDVLINRLEEETSAYFRAEYEGQARTAETGAAWERASAKLSRAKALQYQREDKAVVGYDKDRWPDVPMYTSNRETKREKQHRAWYNAVFRRVEERALEHAKGDKTLAGVYAANMKFGRQMKPSAAHVRKDGSRWWQVGQNASHAFFLGFLADGTYARASLGEDEIFEGDEDFEMAEWLHQREFMNRTEHQGKPCYAYSARLRVKNGKLVRSYWADAWSQRPVENEGS
jgi:hypothetical protein